ncbi:MAG: helix-turn-helix domain-containing protein [Deltaproteobacteria bacterium]|jgi:transcriptional regulator with XRE-family HTH domain|nr:helix-turn-helix domain-containing protein [Deltaproteobacteria bacterium]
MEDDEKIARRFMPLVLRRCRNQAGLSQQQLADSVGVSKGFISALEGGRSVPNLDMLVQLAEALNVSAGSLVNAMVDEAAKMNRRTPERRQRDKE